jgi:hypothetical protein
MEIKGAGRGRNPSLSKTSTSRFRVTMGASWRQPNPNGYPTCGHFCGIGRPSCCFQTSGLGFVEWDGKMRSTSEPPCSCRGTRSVLTTLAEPFGLCLWGNLQVHDSPSPSNQVCDPGKGIYRAVIEVVARPNVLSSLTSW